MAYIHLNPFREGLVQTIQQLAWYPWRGHAVLMGKVAYDWIDRDYVLQFFGRKEETGKNASLEFVEQEVGVDREEELSGGGFVRSRGGWSKVLSMRKRGEKVLGDERILGGDEFVRAMLNDADDRKEVQHPAKDRLPRFNETIEPACSAAGITVTFLRSGSRCGELPRIRKSLARTAVCEYGLSLAETACQLGVTTSAVSVRLIWSRNGYIWQKKKTGR